MINSLAKPGQNFLQANKLFLKMSRTFIEDQTFEKVDYTQKPLPQGEYDYCTFAHCNFSHSDLSGINFLECKFIDCNLSLAKLHKTSFRDVQFKDCKLLGLLFENCSEYGLSFTFDHCSLDDSSFFGTKIKNTVFRNAVLKGVDFSGCDVSHSVFDHCDLAGASFENTNLEKADFRTAYNYTIHPEINRMKKAKFSLSGVRGLLVQYDLIIEEA